MRKIVAIGGVPGTGKTTLMRKFMEDYEFIEDSPKKTLNMMRESNDKFCILGTYKDDETFAGTDRLSMAVQPVAKEWLEETDINVLFEGDRLFNQSFLEHCIALPNTEVVITYIHAPQVILQERYTSRGSDQSEKFLRGRETKYNNILSNFELMPLINEFPNVTYEDQSKLIDFLKSHLIQ